MTLSPLARATIKNQAVVAEVERDRREKTQFTNVPIVTLSSNLSEEPLASNEWFWEGMQVNEKQPDGSITTRPATPFEKSMFTGKKA